VPNTSNAVGVKWRACVVENDRNTTALDDAADDNDPKGWEITAAEKALIESGAVIEISTRIDIDKKFTGTLAEKN